MDFASTLETKALYAKLSWQIIGCGMRVHTALGPGLLESAYQECLCHELKRAGLQFRREMPIPITYREVTLATEFRLDLLIEEAVVVEVKAVEQILKLHEAQLLTYLRMTGKRFGLLLNFNTVHFRDGVRRRVL